MITISNCLNTGLTRKIEYNFFWYTLTQQIIIECHVHYFDANNEIIETEGIHTYTRNLVASDSLVDATNGRLLSQSEIDSLEYTTMAEYDYYAQMAYMPIALATALANIIALRDSEGKFNV